jgi:hypothetical protein
MKVKPPPPVQHESTAAELDIAKIQAFTSAQLQGQPTASGRQEILTV